MSCLFISTIAHKYVRKAFGDFQGGALRYWGEDDGSLTLEELERQSSAMVLERTRRDSTQRRRRPFLSPLVDLRPGEGEDPPGEEESAGPKRTSWRENFQFSGASKYDIFPIEN